MSRLLARDTTALRPKSIAEALAPVVLQREDPVDAINGRNTCITPTPTSSRPRAKRVSVRPRRSAPMNREEGHCPQCHGRGVVVGVERRRIHSFKVAVLQL